MSARWMIWPIALPLALLIIVACGDAEEEIDQDSPTPSSPTETASTGPLASESATRSPEVRDSYTSPGGEYVAEYPVTWIASEVASSNKVKDFVSAVEFYDSSNVLRASIYVFGNPNGLGVEDWIKAHDPAFFEQTIEEATIDDHRALVSKLNFEGRESPLAYVEGDGQVVSIKGLAADDFAAVFDHLRLE